MCIHKCEYVVANCLNQIHVMPTFMSSYIFSIFSIFSTCLAQAIMADSASATATAAASVTPGKPTCAMWLGVLDSTSLP